MTGNKVDISTSSAVDAIITAGAKPLLEAGCRNCRNFSVRLGDSVAITRSGRDKGQLVPEDIAIVPLAAPPAGDLSAEAALHFARYAADSQVGAVFHAHVPSLPCSAAGRQKTGS